MNEAIASAVKSPIFMFGHPLLLGESEQSHLNDRFVFIAPTVEAALTHARGHSGSQDLDRVEFFDANGRPLRVIGSPDTRETLILQSGREYLETRVRRVFRRNEKLISAVLNSGEAPPDLVTLLRQIQAEGDFEPIVSELVRRTPPPEHFGHPDWGNFQHMLCHAGICG